MGEGGAIEQPGPAALWQQAHTEHPDDVEARRDRFLALMIEAGHVIKKEPGDTSSSAFPCGYDPRDQIRRQPTAKERLIESCLPSGACSCPGHQPGGMDVHHVVACCDQPHWREGDGV